MKAQEILEENREAIEALCLQFGVTKLSLFGSSVRGDWNPETSDYDFLAEFGTLPEGIDLFAQQFVFQVEMEGLLRHKVDIVDWAAAKKPLFGATAQAQAIEWFAA